MCELMTIAAAAVFTVWHFALKRAGRRNEAVFTTMLMFWGAALMWAVDCAADAMEGGPLLDMSADDFKLGLVIVASGLAVFGVLSLCGRRHVSRA